MTKTRMNEKFAARWRDGHFDEVRKDSALHERVCAAVDAPFIRKNGCLLLEPLIFQATHADAFPDRTGYEAFINKIHIDDLIEETSESEAQHLGVLVLQGAAAALRLAQRLERESGRFRVLLSLDTDLPTMTLRFFQRRSDEPWGAEDPEDFLLEEVLMIDVDPT